ncbi:MAG: hypothetical protein HPY85_16495 [Anaerolineae bacterium]|nr:hypothetical protein [Anaerolineae bacterium]
MHQQQVHKRILLRTILVLLVAVLAGLAAVQPVRAQEKPPIEIPIYFFWGDGCPHCENEHQFMQNDLLPRYPNVVLYDYETWYNQDNQDLFNRMAEAYGFVPQGVPTTFVGNRYFVGFTETIGDQIEALIVEYMEAGQYPDPMARLAGETTDAEPEPTPTVAVDPESTILTLPLLGIVDLSKMSLFASTVLISVIDGFNPCSLWVLSMLLALSLHTNSRKKVFLIGGVFITVTAAVYAVFILGLFSVMSIVRYLGWIQVLVSLVAIAFALINIKDYFWFKQGVSLTIADDKKSGIYKKMRQVVNSSNSTWGTVSATVVLALGVSLIEFSCTAGLPMLWTNLLNAQQVSALTFGLLLLVYMVIYQIDELIIFIPAALTLRSSKFEEKQGRTLKLIGGILMLTLAVVLLVDPAYLNSLGSTLVIFGIALGVSGLILLMHRVVLPKYGIVIGSEATPQNKRKSGARRR